eukprot:TRINITY_DN9793_c0_g1_i1.p1 TRINITY_DN9793_c0_g1~~TRINITY_DN9793_c0_g1_i1.p1  ORF type:complete len:293 (-),score=10.91 TRINITY_DN9793_c0_g1_i1:231-1073(-)
MEDYNDEPMLISSSSSSSSSSDSDSDPVFVDEDGNDEDITQSPVRQRQRREYSIPSYRNMEPPIREPPVVIPHEETDEEMALRLQREFDSEHDREREELRERTQQRQRLREDRREASQQILRTLFSFSGRPSYSSAPPDTEHLSRGREIRLFDEDEGHEEDLDHDEEYDEDNHSHIGYDPLARLMAQILGAGVEEENLEEIVEGLEDVPNPLPQHILNQLPTRTISEVELPALQQSENKSCPICLTDYDANDSVRTITCLHMFHKSCIDQWFKQTNLSHL